MVVSEVPEACGFMCTELREGVWATTYTGNPHTWPVKPQERGEGCHGWSPRTQAIPKGEEGRRLWLWVEDVGWDGPLEAPVQEAESCRNQAELGSQGKGSPPRLSFHTRTFPQKSASRAMGRFV